MKKLIAVAALTALPFATVMADEDIGCGLGSMVWKGQEGLAPKILGATTNGTSGNQTFGITFGTLGCESEGEVTSREDLALFIDGNMDKLARDVAVGEGEALRTLAALWGIEESDKTDFFAFSKAHYSDVFSTENVTSREVLAALNSLMAEDGQLQGYSFS